PTMVRFTDYQPTRHKATTEEKKTTATREPTTAISMVGRGRERPKKAIPETTASDAPDRTPKMPGSAKGLRVTPCKVVPDIASAAPTNNAMTVRGKRVVAAACSAVSVAPPIAASASSIEMDRTPNITDKTPANAKATSKPHNTA